MLSDGQPDASQSADQEHTSHGFTARGPNALVLNVWSLTQEVVESDIVCEQTGKPCSQGHTPPEEHHIDLLADQSLPFFWCRCDGAK